MRRPIAHWPLNGHADDLVGANKGTWVGTEKYAFNKIGKVVSDFNGVSYITTVNCCNVTTGNFTIAFTLSGSISGGRIVAKKDTTSAASSPGYIVYLVSTTAIVINVSDGTNRSYFAPTIPMITDNPQRYLMTVDKISGYFTVYVDGKYISSGVGAENNLSTIGSLSNTKVFTIGAESDGDTPIANGGKLRDVMFWNVALTADEAVQDYVMSLTPSHYLEAPLPIPQKAPLFSPSGAWGFNNGLKSVDVSGNGYTATLSNTNVDDKGRYVFNGSSSVVSTLKTITATTGKIVFSFWAYSNSYAGTATFIGGSAINCIQIRSILLNLQVLDGGSGWGGFTTTSSPLVANKWQHLVLIFDATNNIGTFYVDGSSVGSGALTPATYADGLYMWIGASYNGQYFNGKIGSVACYSDITEAQIKQIYNRGVPEPSLLELVRGDKDSSVYGRTLTRANVKGHSEWMEFDGNSGSISMADISDLTGDITIECEFYADTWGENGGGRIFDNGKLIVYISTLSSRLAIMSNGATTAVSGTSSVSLLNPTHAVITRTSAGITNFYVNGSASGTADQSSGTPAAGTTNLFVGNRQADDRTFDGKLRVRVLKGIKSAWWAYTRYMQTRYFL